MNICFVIFSRSSFKLKVWTQNPHTNSKSYFQMPIFFSSLSCFSFCVYCYFISFVHLGQHNRFRIWMNCLLVFFEWKIQVLFNFICKTKSLNGMLLHHSHRVWTSVLWINRNEIRQQTEWKNRRRKTTSKWKQLNQNMYE